MFRASNSAAAIEGRLLVDEVNKGFPVRVEGRQAIVEMREGGSRHWRQMEWIGFYPEFWFGGNLAPKLGTTSGPRYGSVDFDIRRHCVWDLKAHSGQSTSWAPLNDVAAVRACIENHQGLGFIVLSGDCDYDEDGSFKAWHDEYKGGKSAYSKRIERRGARSRRRKISFSLARIVAFRFDTVDELERAQSEGWIRGFQEGMQNSNGVARRPKIQVDLANIPSWSVVSEAVRGSGCALRTT